MRSQKSTTTIVVEKMSRNKIPQNCVFVLFISYHIDWMTLINMLFLHVDIFIMLDLKSSVPALFQRCE